MRSLLTLSAAACTAILIAGCGDTSSTGTTTVPTTRVGATTNVCGPFETRTAANIMLRHYDMTCSEARAVMLRYIGGRVAPAGWECAPARLTTRSTSGSCQSPTGPQAASANWRLTTE